MSPNLPIISWMEVVKAFQKIGYQVVRQRGSHLRLRDRANPNHNPLTIPKHKTLKPGLLRKLIWEANISVADFNKLIRKSKKEI